MRKITAMLLCMALLAGSIGAVPVYADDSTRELPTHAKGDVSVEAVFAAADAQEIKDLPDAENTGNSNARFTDTIWIYYSDNTFDQYAQIEGRYELFSRGTYAFNKGSDFNLGDKDDDIIEISRFEKYSWDEKGLASYNSTHEYNLNTIGFTQLFGPADKKEVEALFGAPYRVAYENEEGILSRLDSIELYFTDGSFCDYVFLDGEVLPNGSGTYELSDRGDFHLVPGEKDSGTITLTWDEDDSANDLGGKTQIFDLGTMGSQCFYAKGTGEPSEEQSISRMKEALNAFDEAHPEYKEAWGEIMHAFQDILTEEFSEAFSDVQEKLQDRIDESDSKDVDPEVRKEEDRLSQKMA